LDDLHVLPSPVPHTKLSKINEIHEKGDRGGRIEDLQFSKEESGHLFSDFGVREGDSGAEPDAVEISYFWGAYMCPDRSTRADISIFPSTQFTLVQIKSTIQIGHASIDSTTLTRHYPCLPADFLHYSFPS